MTVQRGRWEKTKRVARQGNSDVKQYVEILVQAYGKQEVEKGSGKGWTTNNVERKELFLLACELLKCARGHVLVSYMALYDSSKSR